MNRRSMISSSHMEDNYVSCNQGKARILEKHPQRLRWLAMSHASLLSTSEQIVQMVKNISTSTKLSVARSSEQIYKYYGKFANTSSSL